MAPLKMPFPEYVMEVKKKRTKIKNDLKEQHNAPINTPAEKRSTSTWRDAAHSRKYFGALWGKVSATEGVYFKVRPTR